MEATFKNEPDKSTVNGPSGNFRNAFSGIEVLLKTQTNARIHVIILVLVIAAGIILKITPIQWISVSVAAGLVLAAECFNTAIEYLCDSIIREYDSRIKKVKDLAAAGVLISAIVSVVVGLIIFVPSFFRILK